MRDDYLSIVEDWETHWPELHSNTDVIRFYMNMFVNVPFGRKCFDENGNPILCEKMPLTDDELETLIEYFPPSVDVEIETAGVKLQEDSGLNDDGIGTAQAEDESRGVLSRWTGAGGAIDIITPDHPILNIFDWYKKFPDSFDIDSPTGSPYMVWAVKRLVDYYREMHLRYPDSDFGLIGAPTAFSITTESGYEYSPKSPVIDDVTNSDFASFWSLLMAELDGEDFDLNHYVADVGPHSIDSDDGTAFDKIYDFGRLLQVEKIVKQSGVKFGMFFHPGKQFSRIICGPGEEPNGDDYCDTAEEGNRGQYELIREFVSEYLSAGGRADLITFGGWHNYPIRVGPETDSFTWMNTARDATNQYRSAEQYEYVQYFEDDFEADGLGEIWLDSSSSGQWSIADSVLTHSVGGAHALTFEGDDYHSLIAEVSVKISDDGFAGIHFRKNSPADLAWVSGYTVIVRDTGKIQLRKAESLVAETDPRFVVPSEFSRIRIEAVDQTIRVFVNSERIFDVASDSSVSGGYLSLDAYGTGAEFDSFMIERLPERTLEVANDFDGDPPDQFGQWESCSRGTTWVVQDGELAQTDGSGVATLRRVNQEVYGSLRMSALIRLVDDGGDGFAGISMRREDPCKTPWNDGFSVYAKQDGTLVLRMVGGPGGILIEQATDLDWVSQSVRLDVVFDDNRVIARIDGKEIFNVYDVWDGSLAVGEIGLVTFNQEAFFDDIVVYELSE
jgi:hypothetical protein